MKTLKYAASPFLVLLIPVLLFIGIGLSNINTKADNTEYAATSASISTPGIAGPLLLLLQIKK